MFYIISLDKNIAKKIDKEISLTTYKYHTCLFQNVLSKIILFKKYLSQIYRNMFICEYTAYFQYQKKIQNFL